MKTIGFIYETNDYSLFKTLDGNRELNKVNVKRLKESMNDNYLISPIIVNEKMEVIDGQHRLHAASELGFPINYIVCPGYQLKEVQILNSNMKNWTMYDYLESYCNLGIIDYLQCKEFLEMFPAFGISAATAILSGYASTNSVSKRKKDVSLISEQNKTGAYQVNDFKIGTFQVHDFKNAIAIGNKIMQIAPLYNGYNRLPFVLAMLGVMRLSVYDHDQFLKRLAANPLMLKHASTVLAYKEQIEEIYNFRSRDKVSLRFKSNRLF